MDIILKATDLKKYYGSGDTVTKALDGVSFEIERGEFTAIMGASGSGKSTLLNVVSTIDRATSGEILIDGSNLTELSESKLSDFRRDKLGFIFQDYNLLDTLTISENITLPLNLKRISAQETEEKLKKAVAALGIENEIMKFPHELSGGQRQRAACARALITNPTLILADEPTGALDSANSKSLMNTFEMMNKALGSTILMVTHDPAVGSYADRILFLKDGRIWNEIKRGGRSRREMYEDILNITAISEGESNAR